MIAILSLLIIVTMSIVVTRIATIALTHTGLSREAARFQARSAFTGAGFTTQESEMVTNHPIRRRIVLTLMLLGNAGFVTAISSLILSFVDRGDLTSVGLRIGVLAGGLAVLWLLASSRWIDRHLRRLINYLLRRFTRLEVRDYASLLQLTEDYGLNEMDVASDSWLRGKPLSQAGLRDEGISVLGIRRADDTYIGSPNGDTTVKAGDTLILYGRQEAIEALDLRTEGSTGDAQHDKAIDDQEAIEAQEKAADEANA